MTPGATSSPRIEAAALDRRFDDGPPLFGGLDLALGPGLHWIVGDEGRGKTTLLRLLAGRLAPTAGTVQRSWDGPVWLEDPLHAGDDPVAAQAWLQARRAGHAGWCATREHDAVAALGLSPHLHKPLDQLSAGSRRKVGLAGALACGARAVFLDQPFAALDAASCRVLASALDEAALATDRIWVVADYQRANGCAGGATIDLDVRP